MTISMGFFNTNVEGHAGACNAARGGSLPNTFGGW